MMGVCVSAGFISLTVSVGGGDVPSFLLSENLLMNISAPTSKRMKAIAYATRYESPPTKLSKTLAS